MASPELQRACQGAPRQRFHISRGGRGPAGRWRSEHTVATPEARAGKIRNLFTSLKQAGSIAASSALHGLTSQ